MTMNRIQVNGNVKRNKKIEQSQKTQELTLFGNLMRKRYILD